MEIINNIQENNKLIAEFMGLTIITDEISWFDTNYKPLKKYNKFWDDLMPVIEKIGVIIYKSEGWGNSFGYSELFSELRKRHCHYINGTMSSIETVYDTVVEFIKWYNKNKENGNKD